MNNVKLDLYSQFEEFLDQMKSIEQKLSDTNICNADQLKTLNILLQNSVESFKDFIYFTLQENKTNTEKMNSLFNQLENDVISVLF